MIDSELVDLGGSKLDQETNAVTWQCKGPVVYDDGTAVDYSDTPVFQCLGVTSRPSPATDEGNAQGVVIEVPGFDGVCVGARDTRTAKIVGALKPGDTALHSTGPQQAAMVLCKEDERIVAMRTKGNGANAKDMAVMLDGKREQFVVSVPGGYVGVDDKDGILLTDKTGQAGIQIKDGIVSIFGKVVLGGRTPVALVTGSPIPLPVPVPTVPVPPATFVPTISTPNSVFIGK